LDPSLALISPSVALLSSAAKKEAVLELLKGLIIGIIDCNRSSEKYFSLTWIFVVSFVFQFSWQVQPLPGLSSMKSMQYPSTGPAGSRHFLNRSSSVVLSTNERAEAATFEPLIGRKVWTRWPDDNNFYEAVITDYNHAEVCWKF
jgi:hypothetical protein